MSPQIKTELISRIIELELENTDLIFKGHKPSNGDFFESKRQELSTLRCIVYGYESKFCKKSGSSKTLFL